MIKDSGERTEFSTGAVRDMHAGKGRFDLLPLHAIHDVARHCEDGAAKYGERNVDKGIPQHSLIDSAIRHLVKYMHNETDEPHLRAAAWNVLWALEQETTHPELIDLPGRGEAADIREDPCMGCIHRALSQTEEPCTGCKRNVFPVYEAKDLFEPFTQIGRTKLSDGWAFFLKGFSPHNETPGTMEDKPDEND